MEEQETRPKNWCNQTWQRNSCHRLVFGILCPGGQVWAQVVPDVEAKTLLPRICRRLEVGSSVCSDSWTSDTGLAAKG